MGAICYILSWTAMHSRDAHGRLPLAGMADAIQGHVEVDSKRMAADFKRHGERGKLAWRVAWVLCSACRKSNSPEHLDEGTVNEGMTFTVKLIGGKGAI
jgi:hypothetical protein